MLGGIFGLCKYFAKKNQKFCNLDVFVIFASMENKHINHRDQIAEMLESEDLEKVLFCDGFDEAIIGYLEEEKKVVYSKSKMIMVLLEEDMVLEEALEFLEFNTWNTFVGDHTPLYINDFWIYEI